MLTYVTSDVHLGSRHCRLDAFSRFIERLPAGAALVLNGDILDRDHQRSTGRHQEVLELLLQESRRRRVVWVAGNHDEAIRPVGSEGVEFVPMLMLPGRMAIVHGFYLYRRLPGYRPLALLLMGLHELRIRMGARPVHVAEYAKRWPLLYGMLCRRMRDHAVRYAREQGVPAVVCGHLHYAEDTMVEGIRYVNTGAWTESPSWCFRVEDEGAALCRVRPDGGLERGPLPSSTGSRRA